MLHPGDYVICADEKPSIQARKRIAPTRPARPGAGQRVEHEYERMGALCYLAAWDAHRAKIFDRCAAKDGIDPFDQVVEQFMFGRRYEEIAAPFQWTFTRQDLNTLLAKSDTTHITSLAA